ncbi:MAG TPA: ABC transporter ATP-binding protein [Acidimicrobiia bacterium]|nr:ABC transporter ATP-binding protein [Acidimicrobiia bacterium]
MTEPAIRADHISKRYRLGSAYGYKTLRESVMNLRRRTSTNGDTRTTIWALDDVSFEIEPGELVGVIGRNGAGKTTILKVLSRITRPTKGTAEIRGRIGALLEVGTGFHPELTGRENVFLNGAILGMRRTEIQRRFDEIVEFAEVGDFLDTPTKRYSSGMQVRLAFAVAAHLEPEILIVDEVLAVGDLAFQKKCLGKMGEVTSQGRTVLFVSHNISLIQSLCRRGILFSHGSIVIDAPIEQAVRTYLSMLEEIGTQHVSERLDRRGWGQVRVTHIDITEAIGSGRLITGRPATFALHLDNTLARTTCAFTIYNHLGQPVTTFDSQFGAADDCDDETLGNCFECRVQELPLMPGRYRIDVVVHANGHLQDHVEGAAFFDVEPGPMRGRPVAERAQGDTVVAHHWRRPYRDIANDR